MSATRRKRTDNALPGLEGSAPKRDGVIYKGVLEQLKQLREDDPEGAAAMAGLAAAARQLAHNLDVASGHGGGKVETYALPQLHRELRGYLETLAGRGGGTTDAEALAALLNGPDDETGGA